MVLLSQSKGSVSDPRPIWPGRLVVVIIIIIIVLVMIITIIIVIVKIIVVLVIVVAIVITIVKVTKIVAHLATLALDPSSSPMPRAAAALARCRIPPRERQTDGGRSDV